MGIVTLWHGGRGLHRGYQDSIVFTKGRFEYGPGLYLTTHYDTARDYAKGGGSTYQVNVEEGERVDQVDVPYEVAEEFVRKNVMVKFRNKRLGDIRRVMNRTERTKLAQAVSAVSHMNLMVNGDVLPVSA